MDHLKSSALHSFRSSDINNASTGAAGSGGRALPVKSKARHAYFEEGFTPTTQKKVGRYTAQKQADFSSASAGRMTSSAQSLPKAEFANPYKNLMTSTYAKDNAVLRPYLKDYSNVDENELHRRAHSNSYLLLKEDKPNAYDNVSSLTVPDPLLL